MNAVFWLTLAAVVWPALAGSGAHRDARRREAQERRQERQARRHW